ncbi:hypothetical protein [Pelagibacterium xiamenense]|uniref:hypothetical protein n=1 Tax=Pelagibacterium xiamenense TaxID=2901140 RepID=UPI001E2D8B3F|nr:hypothetical protein [Pelagibacterium xiamenense]MCD7061400.1 hypothetical protein [Pelagibacterium xiamenense]
MGFCFRVLLSISICCFNAPLMAMEVFLTVAEASLPEGTDGSRSDVVYVKLDPSSTQAFAVFSGEHIGETAEFYVGDQLVFSARLSEAITSGNLALFVGGEDKRISTPEDLLAQLEAGASIKVIVPPAED